MIVNSQSLEHVRALLAAGRSNRAIARELGINAKRVATVRAGMGLPSTRGRFPAGLSLVESWRVRTVPGAGGHLMWDGATTKQGSPVMRYRRDTYTAHRIAFKVRTGHWPDGTAKAECGVRLCVEPSHVDDTATRNRDRKALAAVLGRNPRVTHCRRGHDLAVHASYREDGIRWCRACKRVKRAASAASPAAVIPSA
ncbi:hypothetical protein [Kitasatospora atroaurantiaca]|uniref:hypothetical protein n=1 Tax=Kitasatospora atroaurantiaca TaxID=285545 RepID=UPI0011AA29FB|nr:hypothetical protein [Kitasatospora atroaurantiaca]